MFFSLFFAPNFFFSIFCSSVSFSSLSDFFPILWSFFLFVCIYICVCAHRVFVLFRCSLFLFPVHLFVCNRVRNCFAVLAFWWIVDGGYCLTFSFFRFQNRENISFSFLFCPFSLHTILRPSISVFEFYGQYNEKYKLFLGFIFSINTNFSEEWK